MAHCEEWNSPTAGCYEEGITRVPHSSPGMSHLDVLCYNPGKEHKAAVIVNLSNCMNFVQHKPGEKNPTNQKEHKLALKPEFYFPQKYSQSEINPSLLYSVLLSEVFIKALACLNGLHSMSSSANLLVELGLGLYTAQTSQLWETWKMLRKCTILAMWPVFFSLPLLISRLSYHILNLNYSKCSCMGTGSSSKSNH